MKKQNEDIWLSPDEKIWIFPKGGFHTPKHPINETPPFTVEYIGEKRSDIDLTPGKHYTVTSIEKDWFRLIDDMGPDDEDPPGYLYPPEFFKLVHYN